MTKEEKINSIGIFEIAPKVDFCKDCVNCDLEIETREYCYMNTLTTETRAVCKYANLCQTNYERCMREEA